MSRPRRIVRAARAPAANETEHPSRSLWNGSIGFGLVQIPVALYSREQTHDLIFHQIDRRDGSLVGYERVNKNTHKSVAWDDIAKGYEIQKGQYVIVTDEDFQKANVAATQTIEIQDFVHAEQIPPAFFDRSYAIFPDKRGTKAYAVLRDALARKKLAAVALVVIRTRQHLCAVLAEGDVLTLELLRFGHELRPLAELSKQRRGASTTKATAKEVALAEQLIDGMVVTWDSAKYRDNYRDDLLLAIRQKAETGVVEPRNTPTARRGVAIDLASLLEKSLATAKRKRSRPRAA